MRYILVGVKFLKYDFTIICNKLLSYRFFRDSSIELVLLCQFKLDLVKFLSSLNFFRFEFFFCNLFFFFVNKRHIYFVCYLFLSLFKKLFISFVRSNFIWKFGEEFNSFSVFELVRMKGLVKFEGVGNLYNLTLMYDDIVSLLNRYTDGYDIFNFFLDYELKFLFGLLFSKSFIMFCLESYVWDSEKNIFLSGSLSRLLNISTSIDRMQRYKDELDGYLLLALLNTEGVLWYFSMDGQPDFTYLFFEDVVDCLDFLERKFAGRFTRRLKVIFRQGLLFCDWRDFLLDLWFGNVILYSWSGRFLNCNLLYNIFCSYNKQYLYNSFGPLTIRSCQSIGVIVALLVGLEWNNFKICSSWRYKVYYLKRRV